MNLSDNLFKTPPCLSTNNKITESAPHMCLQLHNSDYDHGKALQALVKCPVPDGIEKKWSEDDRVSGGGGTVLIHCNSHHSFPSGFKALHNI